MSSTHIGRRLVTGAVVGAGVIATALVGGGMAAASEQAGIASAQVKSSIAVETQRGLAESSRPVVKRGSVQQGLTEATRRVEPVKRTERTPEPEPAASEPQRAQVAPGPAPVRQAPAPAWRAPAPVHQAPAPAPAPAPVHQAPAPQGITIDLGGRGPVVPQAPILPKQLHLG